MQSIRQNCQGATEGGHQDVVLARVEVSVARSGAQSVWPLLRKPDAVADLRAGQRDDALSKRCHGIGTDRFVVEWRIASDRVARALAGEREDAARFAGTPVVN